MTWATYNTSNWPNVLVHLNNQLDDQGFDKFLNDWLALYEREENFTLIFDCSDVGWVSSKYAFRMSTFVKKLKALPVQYLEKSIILYDSWYVKSLLNIIFFLETPVAPVRIIKKKNINDNYISLLKQ